MMDEEEGGFIKKKEYDPTKQEFVDTVFCTIRMLNDAFKDDNDDFEWKGTKLKFVVIVGRAYNYTKESIRETITINDNTGHINAMAYKSPPIQDHESIDLFAGYTHVDGAYVKIIGKIVGLKETTGIVIENIRAIKDHNEITHHLIRVFKYVAYKKYKTLDPTLGKTLGTTSTMEGSTEIEKALIAGCKDFTTFRIDEATDFLCGKYEYQQIIDCLKLLVSKKILNLNQTIDGDQYSFASK